MATRIATSTVKHTRDSRDSEIGGLVELVYTDDLLAGAASFTSAYAPSYLFSKVIVAYTANVSGTLNLDFSQDGVNVLNTVSIAAGVTGAAEYPTYGKYVRVRFVNGATIQTSFYLAVNGKTA